MRSAGSVKVASRSSRVASQKQKAHSPTPIRSLRKTPARRIDTRESAKPKSPADKHPTSTSRRQQKRTSVSSSASKKRPRPSRSARVRKKSKVADKDESQSESPKVLRSSTRSRSIRLPKEQATTPSESTTARRASTKRGKKASAGNTTDEDPYDLSTDENESPTSSSGARAVSPAAPSQATEPVSKMRKFFQTRGEGLAKRTALSAFDLLRRKLCGVGGKGQVAKVSLFGDFHPVHEQIPSSDCTQRRSLCLVS
uniref:Origin recognition complex subunit 1 n=1 Tax=Mesocestoides corti TaxID=53468 RepID=A0A5K3FVB0_MESCO